MSDTHSLDARAPSPSFALCFGRLANPRCASIATRVPGIHSLLGHLAPSLSWCLNRLCRFRVRIA
ncbi:hypothetical protein AMTR_s00086p00142960 [Amborella trichopoda]|uniref:Uncharacterized protein n=1 Tax=Amborella trichopoda TaxID=13333 RepID=W1NZ00_AMBTC|nr:hypothetical protein AMTR_s00086p00142960 [Amborella trichopoda]